jgi:hypothetical protein
LKNSYQSPVISHRHPWRRPPTIDWKTDVIGLLGYELSGLRVSEKREKLNVKQVERSSAEPIPNQNSGFRLLAPNFLFNVF